MKSRVGGFGLSGGFFLLSCDSFSLSLFLCDLGLQILFKLGEPCNLSTAILLLLLKSIDLTSGLADGLFKFFLICVCLLDNFLLSTAHDGESQGVDHKFTLCDIQGNFLLLCFTLQRGLFYSFSHKIFLLESTLSQRLL